MRMKKTVVKNVKTPYSEFPVMTNFLYLISHISAPPVFRSFFVNIVAKKALFCSGFSQKLRYNLQCFICSF